MNDVLKENERLLEQAISVDIVNIVVHANVNSDRTFTLVENVCPLTRITTTAIVPFRKPVPIESNASKLVVTLVYSRKPKEAKTTVSVSKSKINKSLVANNKEPNNSWGYASSNVPSSIIECRLSKLFSGIWTPMMSEKKVNTKPVDYAALNQLSKDLETHFVPQTELSAEQPFWSQYSVNSEEPGLSLSTTIVEVPKKLPKVNMVNSSLKKLKFHLASFDVIVKERTTATAITEGTWGFKHTKACFRDEIIPIVALKDLFNSFDQFLIDELAEVQNVFNQME
nr:hypothetical protein [Tanacetum cinerariifolium]